MFRFSGKSFNGKVPTCTLGFLKEIIADMKDRKLGEAR